MFRKYRLAIVIGLALGLSSCAATGGHAPPSTGSPPAAVAPDIPLTIAKAEAAFEVAYNIAGNAYVATNAAHPSWWSADRKAQAKALMAKAYSAVLLARKAQAVGDVKGLADQTAAVVALVNQVLPLVEGSQ